MTDLSIVIASWDGRELLLECLSAIDREVRSRTGPDRIRTETLLVDNGSTDGSADAVRERFPWVEVLALERNLGFAAASNVGLRHAKGRHVVLLNNDAFVLRDALESCVRFLDDHPDAGVVGPRLLNEDGSRQSSVHNIPTLTTELLPRWLLELSSPGRHPSKRSAHAGPVEVEAVAGACLVVRGEVVQSVGLLPEEYFFFLEETAWCQRIHRAGWRVYHLPEARVLHVLGASSKKRLPAETRIEFHRSLSRFFRSERGPLVGATVVAIRVGRLLNSIALGALLVPFSGRRRERSRQNLRLLRWHLRGCPADEGLARPGATA